MRPLTQSEFNQLPAKEAFKFILDSLGTAEQREAFAKDLEELSKKHGLVLGQTFGLWVMLKPSILQDGDTVEDLYSYRSFLEDTDIYRQSVVASYKAEFPNEEIPE